MVTLERVTRREDLGILLFSINSRLPHYFGPFLVSCVHPADMKGTNGAVIIGEEEQKNAVCKKGESLRIGAKRGFRKRLLDDY